LGALEVPDLLAHAAARYPGRACVEVDGRRLNFAEVSERAGRFASMLRERDVFPGDRVAILCLNEAELIEIRVGCQRAGAIAVPLNYRMSERELGAVLADCEPSLLIVGPDLVMAGEAPKGLPILELGADYEAALAGASTALPAWPLPADRLGMIGYTSGTTGAPKGVMLTNAALHATVIAMGQEIAAHPGATYLAAMPMFHVGAQVGFAFTYLGGACVQVRKFQAAEVARLLASGRITHAQLVPTMIAAVLEHWDGGSDAKLERILYGAAPMPVALVRRALESLGCELVNGYGATEAMGISMLSPDEHLPTRAPELLQSVGRSGVGMTVRVVDDDGRELPPHEVGEVVCRGPTLMSGYWRDPDASRRAFRDGWLRTGDLGYRDANGYLFLVARRNDRIVSGGENVYPQEVEDVISALDGVREAAVVGIPDERWGEAVCAAVVREPGSDLSDEELLVHCRRFLTGYKVPKTVRFVQDLPKTATGKILRHELRGEGR
jgi:acyl-CoA synthetase (AMP-forming)/AMP-acid ligase II